MPEMGALLPMVAPVPSIVDKPSMNVSSTLGRCACISVPRRSVIGMEVRI